MWEDVWGFLRHEAPGCMVSHDWDKKVRMSNILNKNGPGNAFFRPGNWLRGLDLNQRPSGYEPDELPGCSTPRSSQRLL